MQPMCLAEKNLNALKIFLKWAFRASAAGCREYRVCLIRILIFYLTNDCHIKRNCLISIINDLNRTPEIKMTARRAQ